MQYELNRDKINGLLTENRVSRIVASKHLEINPATLRRKMKGIHEFTVKELLDLANLLKVDPGIFFVFVIASNGKNAVK